MFLELLHPFAWVTTIGVDSKGGLIFRVHLINDVLKCNHAVFEHPIPGVFGSVTTVVQVDVLAASGIDPGSQCSLFDLRQNRLPLDDGVWVWKEDTMEMVGEVLTVKYTTWSLVQDLLHDVHVNKSTR